MASSSINPDDKPTTTPHFLVDRRAYNQEVFNEAFQVRSVKEVPIREKVASAIRSYCTLKLITKIIRTLFPIIDWTRKYHVRQYLLTDLIVGLTITVFQVPQGMAYGQLADVSPVNGLYTSYFPVLIYAFMGTSKQLSVGTYAVLALMVGGIVGKYPVFELCAQQQNCTTDDPSLQGKGPFHALDIVVILCFLSGLYQFIFGVLRLGSLSVFLSPQLVSGFTTGAAIHIFTSQLKYTSGLHIYRYSGVLNLIYTYIALFKNISATNLITLSISIATILVILFVKEFIEPKVKKKIKFPLPIELVVLTLGIVVSNSLRLCDNYDVVVISTIPTGLPSPRVPNFDLLPLLAYDALPLAIISFASSISIAKIFAEKHNYTIDSNQELIALGAANLFGTFFSCIPATGSLSRSSVQNESGGKTQLVSLVSCVGILVVLLVLAPVLQGLPSCILAAITIVSLKGLFCQVLDLVRYWRISFLDGMIWLVTFVSVVVLNIDVGLGVGVGFSLFTLVLRSQRPKTYLLGEVGSTNVYVPVKRYLVATEIPTVKIFYFGGPLHFANVEYFMKSIERRTGINIRKVKATTQKRKPELTRTESIISIGSTISEKEIVTEEPEEEELPTHIILDCSGFSYIDTPGVITLKKVIEEFHTINITVFVAACPANVQTMLKRADFFKDISKHLVYPTVQDAVLHTDDRF